MPTASCAFVARADAPERIDAVRLRAQTLARFYAPTGLTQLALAMPRVDALAGVIGRTATELVDSHGIVTWGEPLPAALAQPQALVSATAAQLRDHVGFGSAFAWSAGALRVVSAASGPAALYVAEGDGVTAYSTHALAAAVLAGVELLLNAEAVAQFVAFDFVGGDETLLRGVVCPPPAMCVDVGGSTGTWLPPRERWQPVPERDAFAFTERALDETLRRRIGNRQVAIALTAGLDSSAGAIAIHAAGAAASAFTWGEPGWPDSMGAAATAQRLGIEHSVLGSPTLDDDAVLAALDRDARWSDGVTAMAVTERVWPGDAPMVAVGMAGEVGRSFYYDAWSALLAPRPSTQRLARQLGAQGRLAGAPQELRDAVEAKVQDWVADAAAAGATGWDKLDVLYAEQRVRRWGRSQIPPLDQDLLLLFTPIDVMRGLLSLPQRDRLGAGFHGRLLAEHGFDPPLVDVPEFGTVELAARRLRTRIRRRRATPAPVDPVDAYIPWIWKERPRAAEFVADALHDPVVTDVLGHEWAERTSEGFASGRRHACGRALRAAGIVAFARALPR